MTHFKLMVDAASDGLVGLVGMLAGMAGIDARAGMTGVPAGTQAYRSAVEIEMFEVQAGMQAARIVE